MAVNQQDTRYGHTRLPDLDADESDIKSFMERYFSYYSVYRNRHMERMAMNLHYWLGHQWVEPDVEVLLEGVRGYIFRDLRASNDVDLPRPVTNYISPAVEVELASLGKRELIPNILTTSNDPRIEAAAKVAKEILQYRMKVLKWPDIRELATLFNVICGTSIIKSYWDETYSDLTLIGSPNAAQCQACGGVVSSSMIPKAAAGQVGFNSETLQDVPSDNPNEEESLQLTHCPTCPSPVPLSPYEVGPEEAKTSTDFLNRPMGMLVPKGNTAIEIVTPFEFFPQNSGIGITPENCRVWGQSTPRDLDWIEERYPERIEEIQPEDPPELMKDHPILGEWTVLGRYDSGLDSNIYDHHARVQEVHADPTYRFPEGRSIVMVGDVILENGPLLRKIQAEGGEISVPRVNYGAARFKVRAGEFWGHGLVDDLISPQNRLNGMDAQIIDARERMASPNLFIPNNSDFEGPEYRQQYGGGKLMRYTPDPLNPNAKPEVFGGVTIPAEVYQERTQAIQDMKQVAGPQDIEIGEAPRNISTTSGLQLLGEQAERRRAPRERALVSMFENIWSHQLKLMWVLRTEEDTYESENAEGEWEEHQYDRTVIQGQTKVQIEKQAYVDRSLYIREGIREAQADGLIRLDSQLAIKKVLEYRGLPTDVNEGLNRQVDLAKRQFVDFVDLGVIPTIDTTLDDFWIRFQTLGTLLLGDEGQRLEAAAQWPAIRKAISGWEEELQKMQAMDAQAKAFYGGRVDPQVGAEMYAKAMVQHQQQVESTANQLAQAPDVAAEAQAQASGGENGSSAPPQGGGMAPTPPLMPPPPPPIFLPPALEDQVLMVWTNLMSKDPKVAPLLQTEGPTQAFLQFRSVVDAYKLYDLRQKAQMMGGMPGMNAPGGTPGAEPVPAMPPSQPGMDFTSPPNPPNPPNPAPVPGMPGRR